MKNIIFDLGNVLINFHPRESLRQMGRTEEECEFLLQEIFHSPEWIELDRGTITHSEAMSAIKKRNPGKEKLLEENSDFRPLLTAIEENASLLPELKERGYRLFYLTNYHDELFEYTSSANQFFECFEGGIVSAHVHAIKPEAEIYTLLLKKYHMKAEETLFIDDTEINVKGAERLGIQTIHLTKEKTLKEELEKKLHFR